MRTGKVENDGGGWPKFFLRPHTMMNSICQGGANDCLKKKKLRHRHCLCRNFEVRKVYRRLRHAMPLGKYGHCCKCDMAIILVRAAGQ